MWWRNASRGTLWNGRNWISIDIANRFLLVGIKCEMNASKRQTHPNWKKVAELKMKPNSWPTQPVSPVYLFVFLNIFEHIAMRIVVGVAAVVVFIFNMCVSLVCAFFYCVLNRNVHLTALQLAPISLHIFAHMRAHQDVKQSYLGRCKPLNKVELLIDLLISIKYFFCCCCCFVCQLKNSTV